MKFKRDFALEVFFSKWEFSARYNFCGSDMESMSLEDLLGYATPGERRKFQELHLGYTETWGNPELREALASSFEGLTKENILTFAGTEEAIFATMNILLTPADHAILTCPCYQSFETVPDSICETSGVALNAGDHWEYDIDRLEKLVRPNTKLVAINFPNNPTGKVISREKLKAIVEICRKNDLYLLSDEIFRQSERNSQMRLPQVADLYEKGFSISGTAKTYALPGLRIGWIASRDVEVLQKIEKFKHYLTICSSAPSEFLATIAIKNRDKLFNRSRKLAEKYLKIMEEFFARHTDLFEWQTPDGGFYAYPKYLGPGTASEFCQKLLKKEGVLLGPPDLFKSDLLDLPKDRFRIGFNRSFTPEALSRMDRFIERELRGD